MITALEQERGAELDLVPTLLRLVMVMRVLGVRLIQEAVTINVVSFVQFIVLIL